MWGGADDAAVAVAGEVFPAPVLAEGRLGRYAAGRGPVEGPNLVAVGAGEVPGVERVGERGGMHRRLTRIEQSRPVELAQYRHDAAGAADILHMDARPGRGDLGVPVHTA